VEAGLLGDELGGEEPVDLVPRVGDLGGDRVAEDLADRGQQVASDDRVLLRVTPSVTCLWAMRASTWRKDGASGSISCTA